MQRAAVGNAAVHETGSDPASVRQIDKALVRAFQDAAGVENLHSSVRCGFPSFMSISHIKCPLDVHVDMKVGFLAASAVDLQTAVPVHGGKRHQRTPSKVSVITTRLSEVNLRMARLFLAAKVYVVLIDLLMRLAVGLGPYWGRGSWCLSWPSVASARWPTGRLVRAQLIDPNRREVRQANRLEVVHYS